MIPLIVTVFFFAVISVIIGGILMPNLDSSGFFNQTTESRVIGDDAKHTFGLFDYLIMFVLFGLSATSIIGAFFIRTHPALFVISLFILFIAILLAAVFSNVFIEFVNDSGVDENDYQITIFFFKWLPVFALVLSIIIAVALYAINPE
ncbi:hypothetical protein KY333_03765 [Candidatus Woesearchaeota archaeon]|nr:hypothetical protein [Candidatus Woesearchaeota archaeon]